MKYRPPWFLLEIAGALLFAGIVICVMQIPRKPTESQSKPNPAFIFEPVPGTRLGVRFTDIKTGKEYMLQIRVETNENRL